jgi:hypothetical protein
MLFGYSTSATITAGTNVFTNSIKFDLAASSILASRATFDSSADVTLSSYGSEPLTIGPACQNIGIDGNEIQSRANGAAAELYLNKNGGVVHFGSGSYYISSDGSNYSGNAATATKATQDGSGNDIESTYATKAELGNYLPLTGNAATATKLANERTITLTGDTTGTATFDGSANITITTSTNYAPSTIQPFDLYDSNEDGTFWAQTNTNSIAVPFMTDSKVVTNKVRIFIKSTAGAKIRCAIYKRISVEESPVLSLVTQTQLYTGLAADLIDIPFETIATLDSDTRYYFAFECSSSDSTFLGKQINAGLMEGFSFTVYKGDAFNANSDTFKSQYPMDELVDCNVFVPYFKII